MHRAHEEIHHHKVAGASQHDENMEDFVGAEIFMPLVKQGDLQAVYDAADGVDNSSGQQPSETGGGQSADDGDEGQDAQPAHADVQRAGHPFGAGDPQGF